MSDTHHKLAELSALLESLIKASELEARFGLVSKLSSLRASAPMYLATHKAFGVFIAIDSEVDDLLVRADPTVLSEENRRSREQALTEYSDRIGTEMQSAAADLLTKLRHVSMTDDEIIRILRSEGHRLNAVELAQLLDRITDGGLSPHAAATYFQLAFAIPVKVLEQARIWDRLKSGGGVDDELNTLLAPYLKGRSE